MLEFQDDKNMAIPGKRGAFKRCKDQNRKRKRDQDHHREVTNVKEGDQRPDRDSRHGKDDDLEHRKKIQPDDIRHEPGHCFRVDHDSSGGKTADIHY